MCIYKTRDFRAEKTPKDTKQFSNLVSFVWPKGSSKFGIRGFIPNKLNIPEIRNKPYGLKILAIPLIGQIQRVR